MHLHIEDPIDIRRNLNFVPQIAPNEEGPLMTHPEAIGFVFTTYVTCV